jgi:hypothetical protein
MSDNRKMDVEGKERNGREERGREYIFDFR